MKMPPVFKGDKKDPKEIYRRWIRSVERYLQYFREEFHDDIDKIIWVGGLLEDKALAWYDNREEDMKKFFQVDNWKSFTSTMEERFVDKQEEEKSLRRMNDLKYTGDIEDYLTKMETLNFRVCLSGTSYIHSLKQGMNEEILDRMSTAEVPPKDDTAFIELMRRVGVSYEDRLAEKNRSHQNRDNSQGKKGNKRKRDEHQGQDKNQEKKPEKDKGSDPKKPRTEKKGPKAIHTDKAEALKGIPESLLEARAKRNECKRCGSSEHDRWFFCKNPIKASSSKKNKKPKDKEEAPKQETTASSSKVRPRSLADRITAPATHAPSKRLYEVDSDGMEIDD
jgi:hypothetical protein